MKKAGSKKESNEYDFLIIGAGVTGMAAAMYAARLGLRTLCLGKSYGSELPIGGVITTTNIVENYPGFIKLTGTELSDKIRDHALSYPLVTIKKEEAQKVEKKANSFHVKTNKAEYIAKTILFATGTKWRKLDVPGSKEYENKGVAYCALCQPLGEEIISNSNIIPIEKVTPSTRVLTMNGTYQNIAGFTKRPYQGDLVKVTPRFFVEPTTLTPEHPVLALQVHKGNGANYWKDFRFSEPEWKQAGELTEDDCVLYPIIKETQDKETIKISDYLDVKNQEDKIISNYNTHTAKAISDTIKLDKDLMRLFGYYLAEGSAVRHELRFYFNKNEKEYLNDVQKIIKDSFGLETKITYKDNVGCVTLYSKIVADLFKVLFDKYSHSKGLPHFLMLLPPEKQKELIKGLWRGDGCTRDKDFCIVTSSRKLAYQVRDILLRLGIICSLQKRDKEKLNQYKSQINGRDISFTKDKYSLNIGGQFLEKMSEILGEHHSKIDNRSEILKHAWLNNDYAILPIRKIERTPYNGEVLSVAVENTASYVAKNFIVHNCDAPLFKNKIVGLVGGSDSAAKDALVLSEHAKKTYIIYRGEQIHPEPINMRRVEDKIKKGKIEIINNTNVIEIKGNGQFMSSVVFDRPYKGQKEFSLEGLFIAIGHIALSDLAKPLGVKLNEKGEIIIDHKTSETNISGIYAAGDVADKPFKQAITGVAEGCIAAYSAYEYMTNGKVMPT